MTNDQDTNPLLDKENESKFTSELLNFFEQGKKISIEKASDIKPEMQIFVPAVIRGLTCLIEAKHSSILFLASHRICTLIKTHTENHFILETDF
jgi:hypothetical protein